MSGVLTVEVAERPEVRTRIRAAIEHPLLSYYLVVVVGAILLTLGLLMVISASSVTAQVYESDPFYYGKRQVVFAVIGLVGAVVAATFSEKLLTKIAWPVMWLALGLLLLTIIRTPLTVCAGGNCNWLRLGPSWTQFQPSEFAKIAFIVWAAWYITQRGKALKDVRAWLAFLLCGGAMTLFIVAEKDMGTALVMGAIMVIIMICAGAPMRLLAALGGVGLVGMIALIIVEPYRMKRLFAFFNPGSDPLGYDLQATRGIYALASGGWLGQGLGSSRQKWGLLAEAHTDYIFAIIGEELGVMGTVAVIVLFAALAYSGVRVAMRSGGPFNRLVAIGVTAWFSVQAFLNIAVAVRWFPVMGVTLPLVSYGGSSLIANLVALGLLAGCARHEPEARELFRLRKIKSHKKSERIVRVAQ